MVGKLIKARCCPGRRVPAVHDAAAGRRERLLDLQRSDGAEAGFRQSAGESACSAAPRGHSRSDGTEAGLRSFVVMLPNAVNTCSANRARMVRKLIKARCCPGRRVPTVHDAAECRRERLLDPQRSDGAEAGFRQDDGENACSTLHAGT